MSRFTFHFILALIINEYFVEGCGRGGGGSRPPPDRTRPRMTCPASISQRAEPNQTYAFVTWTEPVAVDDRDGNRPVQRNGPAPGSRLSGSTTIGYTARDTSGNLASCQFQIDVFVVHCPPSERIANGFFHFQPGMDFRYGGVSLYGCHRGYELRGESRLECRLGSGENGVWSASTPSCEKITCPTLTSIDRAEIECTDFFRFNSECTYVCDQGYDVPPGDGRKRVCSWRGTWLGLEPTCVDVTPPEWNHCPFNMIVFTNRGTSTATPSWSRPTAIDNSGEEVIVTMVEGFEPGSSVSVGSHNIRYEATDREGNNARLCSFIINVRRVRCPRIYPTHNLIFSCPDGYDWGDECHFSCHDDYELIGESSASCEAPGTPPLAQWSYALNMPSCQGQVCPSLNPPNNGALVCDLWMNGQFCKMFCNDQFDVPSHRSNIGKKLFVCQSTSGNWNEPDVPNCSRTRRGRRYAMTVELHYFSGDCCNEAVQSELRESFVNILQADLLFSDACTLHPHECRMENTRISCGPSCTDSSRKKRELDDKSTMHIRKTRSTEHFDLIITTTVNIPTSEAGGPEGFAEAQHVMNSFVDTISESQALNELQVENVAASLESISTSNVHIVCDEGYVSTETGTCVGCEPGKYFDAAMADCIPCPRGTFHNEESNLVCEPCPYGKTTRREGAQSYYECEDACPLGAFSATGTEPCNPCMSGTYADSLGSLLCTECDVGKTTDNIGASNVSECKEFAVMIESSVNSPSEAHLTFMNGSQNNLAIAFKVYLESINTSCAILTIGEDIKIILNNNLSLSLEIERCSFIIDTTTYFIHENWNTLYLEINGQSESEQFLTVNNELIDVPYVCEDFSLSENMSLSIGKINIDSGFGGRFTDVNIWNRFLNVSEIASANSQCLPQLHGNIIEWDDFKDAELIGASYSVPGYCEVDDTCLDEPCGFHTCIDGINSYRCICDNGFTGINCGIDIDDCVYHSCDENATCIDGRNNYTCECPPNTRGTYCELEIVHGGFSEWSDWSSCNSTCGGGSQTRERTCTQPEPEADGDDCEGDHIELQECNIEECPVCSELNPLANGNIDCNIDLVDYKNCTLECDPGYAFSVEPLPYYLCDDVTTYFEWNFQADNIASGQLPECTEISAATDLASRHDIRWEGMDCSESNHMAAEAVIQEQLESIDCVIEGRCQWQFEITDCNQNDNAIRASSQTSANVYLRIHESLVPSHLPSTDILEVYEPLTNELIAAATEVYGLVENGSFTAYVEQDVYYVEGNVVQPIVQCPAEGMVYDSFYCIPCGRGTREMNGGCYNCERGYYQNLTGQTECVQCPTGYVTSNDGSRSIDDCTERIDPDSSQTKSPSSPNDDLTLAIAIPIVIGILIIGGIICAVILRWKNNISSENNKPGTSYHTDEDTEFKNIADNRPPLGHAKRFPKAEFRQNNGSHNADASSTTNVSVIKVKESGNMEPNRPSTGQFHTGIAFDPAAGDALPFID